MNYVGYMCKKRGGWWEPTLNQKKDCMERGWLMCTIIATDCPVRTRMKCPSVKTHTPLMNSETVNDEEADRDITMKTVSLLAQVCRKN